MSNESAIRYQILLAQPNTALVEKIFALEASLRAVVEDKMRIEDQLLTMRKSFGLPKNDTPTKTPCYERNFELRISRNNVKYGVLFVRDVRQYNDPETTKHAQWLSVHHGHIAIFVKCGKAGKRVLVDPPAITTQPAQVQS